jgi:hypothetical protein
VVLAGRVKFEADIFAYSFASIQLELELTKCTMLNVEDKLGILINLEVFKNPRKS